jgi:hypothetical protein
MAARCHFACGTCKPAAQTLGRRSIQRCRCDRARPGGEPSDRPNLASAISSSRSSLPWGGDRHPTLRRVDGILLAGVAASPRRALPCASAVERAARGDARLAATTGVGRLTDRAWGVRLAVAVSATGRAASVVAADARYGLDRPHVGAHSASILPAWLLLDFADQVGWAHVGAHRRHGPHL